MPDVSPMNAETALIAPSHNGWPSGNLPANDHQSSSRHVRTEEPMLAGPEGTFQALSLMRAAVRGDAGPDFSGYQDPWIVKFAKGLIEGKADQGSIDAAYVVYYFVRDQISYVDHEPDEQVVQDARRTIELGSGDCVSQSVTLSTLLGALGFKSRFIVQMPSIPEGFTHVYVELLYDGQAIALDPIADGESGRSLGSPGWSQTLPDRGFETPYNVF